MKEKAPFPHVTDRPEADYIEMARLGTKLGIPVPQMHVEIEVMQNGQIISSHRQRSRTWTRNFWNMCLCYITSTPGVVTNFGAGYLSFKQTNAAVEAVIASSLPYNTLGLVSNAAFGIQAGTGDDAESFESHALETLIAHGTGATQLSYAAHSALAQAYTSGTKTWVITIKRVLTNTSGGAIIISETALTFILSNLTKYLMFNRDLLAATQNVPNNSTATISYDISLVLPA